MTGDLDNRDVAHLGGFVANSMDALFVMTSATWIVCELVRVYGCYAMREAQKIVDALLSQRISSDDGARGRAIHYSARPKG